MTLGRKVFITYIIGFAIISALFFSYYLPSANIVTITGSSEVRRAGETNPEATALPGKAPVRDVYQMSVLPETGDPVMYRNENTGMGFPWYFKFNSVDIQAHAQTLIQSKQLTAVVYYGWQINYLDMFKNVLKLKPVDSYDASTFTGYQVIAWIGWFIWFVLIAVQIALPVIFRRWKEAREDKKLGVI